MKRRINNINELTLVEKICYVGPYLEINDIDHTFYFHDIIYKEINKAEDKEKLLRILNKFVSKLSESYSKDYKEYVKLMNMDIEFELLPFLGE